MKTVVVIGMRGVVSKLLQRKLMDDPGIQLAVIETERFLLASDPVGVLYGADVVVVCGLEATSEAVVAKIDPMMAVLDVSPTFRTTEGWLYGLPELCPARASADHAYKVHLRVANPGCMATAALLLLEPLLFWGYAHRDDNFYLDAVVGYSAGGTKMIQDYHDGESEPEVGVSFARLHRHVDEIVHKTQIVGDVVLQPKVCNYYSGIRMQVLIPNVERKYLLETYAEFYEGTGIVIDRETPNRINGDEWAGKDGACIRVYEHKTSCLVVCTMDNLGKGAVDSAYDNVKRMLVDKGPQEVW